MVVPKGAIFAAENVNADEYTFVSCVTTPRFKYSGFRLVVQQEISMVCPGSAEDVLYLAYEDDMLKEKKVVK